MTRKDYKVIASTLLRNKDNMPKDEYLLLVDDMATVLYQDNSRFDHNRFEIACGITE